MKHIVLCADDYGQSPSVSAGILALIKNKRISATSCLVNTPYWHQDAKSLIPYEQEIDIGLHLNLTEGRALSKEYIAHHGKDFFSLTTLLRLAFMNKLEQEVIASECQAQIQQFVTRMGFWPHFIDGHHHVHQFPVIRQAFIDNYLTYLGSCNAYVRVVNEKINWSENIKKTFKKLIIKATGTHPLKQLLQYHHIPHNDSFAGCYPFSQSKQYRKAVRGFLGSITDGGLIMCHPGLFAGNGPDTFRYDEYQYLAGDQFLTDCMYYSVKLSRFRSMS